jgi:hypothetical protein
MNTQPSLGADSKRKSSEHIESVGDPPVGRVLNRHETKIDMTAVHFLEYRLDASDWNVFDGVAELLDRG